MWRHGVTSLYSYWPILKKTPVSSSVRSKSGEQQHEEFLDLKWGSTPSKWQIKKECTVDECVAPAYSSMLDSLINSLTKKKKYYIGLKRAHILLYRIMLSSNNTVHTFVGLILNNLCFGLKTLSVVLNTSVSLSMVLISSLFKVLISSLAIVRLRSLSMVLICLFHCIIKRSWMVFLFEGS